MKPRSTLDVPALHTVQGGIDVYAFFVPGSQVLELAEIARIGAGDAGDIVGFQRPEIVAHVRSIAEYLAPGDVLFPNALTLALAPGAKFSAKRGTKNHAVTSLSSAGVLSLPMRNGRKAAWIVDGQQRALALAQSGSQFPVPVLAFVSGDLALHRSQFILVNKVRPLDRRLIDELLPSVGAVLPRDLSSRRAPSALCSILNEAEGSPFQGLIRRPSNASTHAVITDSHITNLIRRSINDPRGALARFVEADGSADLDGMFEVMVQFWSAVRDTFPTAWGQPPERSRLMHGVGLAAVGVLMDEVMNGLPGGHGQSPIDALRRIEPLCRWTSGRWETIGRDWNDLQCTSRDIRLLTNCLIALERETGQRAAA